MTTVNFFIPAGGEGQRLRPLTDQLPKPLLPIARNGEGSYERIIDTPVKIARAFGQRTIVSGFYEGLQVTEYFKNVNDIDTVTDSGIVHIGGSMMQHRDLLFANNPDYVVMIPGDHAIPQTALARMLNHLETLDVDVSLLGTWQYDYHEVYTVTPTINEDGKKVFKYEVASSETKMPIASLGTYAFKAAWLEKRLVKAPVSKSGHSDLTTDIVFGKDQKLPPNLLFEPLQNDEYWQDVGTVRRLYDHIRHLHPQKDSAGNVNLSDQDPKAVRNSVIYVGASSPKEPLSKAFIAKGITERYT